MINSIYNYYLTTYGSSNELKSNTVHKKSELREVYNNILKISRKSPLFKIELDDDTKNYAVSLKENAFALKDIADSLNADSILGFTKRKAVSNDTDKVDVTFSATDDSENSSEFDISISKLATPQINTGNYLSQNGIHIPQGNYSFDINIGEYSYELQFKVNDTDNNRSLQDKLARLINRSDIGISAGVDENVYGNSALKLSSNATGRSFNPHIFTMTNNDSANLADIVDYLGLNNETTEPSNAVFTINGDERSAAGNTFTINGGFELTLKDVTDENESVHIGFKPDMDALMDSLTELSHNYNNIVSMAFGNSQSTGDSAKLYKELQHIAKKHTSALETTGLTFDENGNMKVDESLVAQSVNENNIRYSLDMIDKFKDDLKKEANLITINPMNYVDKTMISYPNPVVSFSNPYITSIYTGMMFNGYV